MISNKFVFKFNILVITKSQSIQKFSCRRFWHVHGCYLRRPQSNERVFSRRQACWPVDLEGREGRCRQVNEPILGPLRPRSQPHWHQGSQVFRLSHRGRVYSSQLYQVTLVNTQHQIARHFLKLQQTTAIGHRRSVLRSINGQRNVWWYFG